MRPKVIVHWSSFVLLMVVGGLLIGTAPLPLWGTCVLGAVWGAAVTRYIGWTRGGF